MRSVVVCFSIFTVAILVSATTALAQQVPGKGMCPGMQGGGMTCPMMKGPMGFGMMLLGAALLAAAIAALVALTVFLVRRSRSRPWPPGPTPA